MNPTNQDPMPEWDGEPLEPESWPNCVPLPDASQAARPRCRTNSPPPQTVEKPRFAPGASEGAQGVRAPAYE